MAKKNTPLYPIHIDDREDQTTPHSPEPFSTRLAREGVPIQVHRLDFGDFFWHGRGGEENPTISIGVERKALTDLLGCMTSGRLAAHQLPGMREGFDVMYLLIEGIWRANPQTGRLQRMGGSGNGGGGGGRGGGERMKWRSPQGVVKEDRGKAGWFDISLGGKDFSAEGLENYILSLQNLSGMTVVFTRSRQDTVLWLKRCWAWWQKGADKHHSIGPLEKPLAKGMGSGGQSQGWVVGGREVETRCVPLTARVAAQLPGIGIGKALEAAKVFGSVAEMVGASPQEWRKVPGVGEVLAKGVVAEINRATLKDRKGKV